MCRLEKTSKSNCHKDNRKSKSKSKNKSKNKN